jgi:prevent-host-death family protein
MTDVNIHKAKTELSKLLVRVENGEEIIISRRNVPVAKLVPVVPTQMSNRKAGALAHLCKALPADLFLEPIDTAEADSWE